MGCFFVHFWTDEAQALGYAVVAAGGHGRPPQVAEKQGSGASFGPYAGRSFQPRAGFGNAHFAEEVQIPAGGPIAAAAHLAQHGVQARSLLLGLSAGPYGVLHGRGGSLTHGVPITKSGP